MVPIDKIEGEVLHEIVLGETKYVHKSNDEKDYLIDQSKNGVKINFSFSKDSAKNKEAIDGLKKFFTELYS